LFAIAMAFQPATSAQSTEQLPRDGATYWPSATWRTAAPGQVGLDAARLDALVQRLRSNAISGLHSLVIVRHGYVAVEEYFNGSAASQVHTMQSVTKSVTSLARVGYLVLRHGKWGSTQVVPASWIEEATRVHTQRPRSLGGYSTDYGWLWWLMATGDGANADTMITASGNMNQWLFVVPRHDLVVVVTGGANQASVPDFVIRDVLPSILRD
jgi:CubicO group peptidase (beta-lactamase class C family)